MKLTMLSLKGVEYQGEVESFNVKTKAGEITILDHHRSLITILEQGPATITTAAGETITRQINSGFLEMNPANHLNVLVD